MPVSGLGLFPVDNFDLVFLQDLVCFGDVGGMNQEYSTFPDPHVATPAVIKQNAEVGQSVVIIRSKVGWNVDPYALHLMLSFEGHPIETARLDIWHFRNL